MNRRGFFKSTIIGAIGAAIPSFLKNAPATVIATPLKLKATWTQEMSRDLMAYHSTKADDELLRCLSKQMSEEIDNEVVRALVAGSKTT